MWSHDAVPPGPNLTSFLLNIQVLETKAGGLRTPRGHPRPGPGASCRGAVGPRGTPQHAHPSLEEMQYFRDLKVLKCFGLANGVSFTFSPKPEFLT